jgi:hypothetical protein
MSAAVLYLNCSSFTFSNFGVHRSVTAMASLDLIPLRYL